MIDPKNCTFQFFKIEENEYPSFFISDDSGDDDIRDSDIDNELFSEYFYDIMENTFISEHFETLESVKEWLESIGMTYDPEIIE